MQLNNRNENVIAFLTTGIFIKNIQIVFLLLGICTLNAYAYEKAELKYKNTREYKTYIKAEQAYQRAIEQTKQALQQQQEVAEKMAQAQQEYKEAKEVKEAYENYEKTKQQYQQIKQQYKNAEQQYNQAKQAKTAYEARNKLRITKQEYDKVQADYELAQGAYEQAEDNFNENMLKNHKQEYEKAKQSYEIEYKKAEQEYKKALEQVRYEYEKTRLEVEQKNKQAKKRLEQKNKQAGKGFFGLYEQLYNVLNQEHYYQRYNLNQLEEMVAEEYKSAKNKITTKVEYKTLQDIVKKCDQIQQEYDTKHNKVLQEYQSKQEAQNVAQQNLEEAKKKYENTKEYIAYEKAKEKYAKKQEIEHKKDNKIGLFIRVEGGYGIAYNRTEKMQQQEWNTKSTSNPYHANVEFGLSMMRIGKLYVGYSFRQDNKYKDNFKVQYNAGHIGFDLCPPGTTLKAVIGGYMGVAHIKLNGTQSKFKTDDTGGIIGGKLGLALELGTHLELELGARSGWFLFGEQSPKDGDFRAFYVNGYGAITFLF